MRSLPVFLSGLLVACAAGGASTVQDGEVPPAADTAPAMPLPAEGATPADPPMPAKDAGGSSSSSSSGGSSTSSTSSSSSSSSSSSTSSSSSGGSSGGACGVCDRNWTCNAATDYWQTVGADCVDTRTNTTLHCNGKFDQGGYTNLGTWSGDATQFVMQFPTLGGGTHAVTCTP